MSIRSISGKAFWLVLIVFGSTFANQVSANLLTNPSFEEPVIPGPWTRYSTIPGWEGSFDLHRDLPVSDGAQLVDLNQNSHGYIRQTFATTPGTVYQLGFDHGINHNCASSAVFSVKIDGVSIGEFTTSATLQHKELTFVAGATGGTELTFESLTSGCGAATIDNVIVDSECSEVSASDYLIELQGPEKNKVLRTGTWKIHLKARVYRPCELCGGPYPLLVFLHGNHSACGGDCYQGYDYLAKPLACEGYIVISIDGKTLPGMIENDEVVRLTYPEDPSLVMARGRLLLSHLERWAAWSDAGVGCDQDERVCAPESLGLGGDGLRGMIDWNNVGLMGHSRGGEGVRAAYSMLNISGTSIEGMSANYLYDWTAAVRPIIKAIYEIAPADGEVKNLRRKAPYPLNANGVAWNVLLPMCDGDKSDQAGIKPFDRMHADRRSDSSNKPKSAVVVWGANHSYYNSMLAEPEPNALCVGEGNDALTAAEQRQTAEATAINFFRAHVGADAQPDLANLFNPLHDFDPFDQVDDSIMIERSYSRSSHFRDSTVLDDFYSFRSNITGGVPRPVVGKNALVNLDPSPEHDPVQRALAVEWDARDFGNLPPYVRESLYPFVQISGVRRNLGNHCTLDFRIARQPDSDLNVAETSDFSIRLVYDDVVNGRWRLRLSPPLQLSSYADLKGPAGGGSSSDPHAILQTVRIPLADFEAGSLSRVRGVRLIFSDTMTGAIYLANFRYSRQCD
ncbi:MAG: DUF642 domain-containing protein [Vicinamibacteria bacterium]|nr:DUF642 domain-containing protein [Vicinamibacteria bacterium]